MNRWISTAQMKLNRCVRLAREESRDSWQPNELTKGQRATMRKLSRESIEDARYWKRELANALKGEQQ